MADKTIAETIEDAARAPAKAAFDGQSAESHSLPDMIEAAKYLDTRTARSRNHLGLTFRQLEPGGTG